MTIYNFVYTDFSNLELQDARELIFPIDSALGACKVSEADLIAHFPEERPALENAVPKRRKEFIAGRSAARTALASFGVLPAALPRCADGTPIWPDGFTGSISHSDQLALAVVAPCHKMQSIGVDLEQIGRSISNSIMRIYCAPYEHQRILNLPYAVRDVAALLVFSVKESIYKCLYQATGKTLDAQQIEIFLRPSLGSKGQIQFNGTFTFTDNNFVQVPLHTSSAHVQGHIITCAWIWESEGG